MVSMGEWMKHHHESDMSLFEILHGKHMWESVQADPAINGAF
jgi:hypothetical protein